MADNCQPDVIHVMTTRAHVSTHHIPRLLALLDQMPAKVSQHVSLTVEYVRIVL